MTTQMTDVIRIDDHTPRREDYEPATDWCIAGPIPGMRHKPSGVYANGSDEPVRDHDWEPDPDQPGYRRIVRGSDGKPTVTRSPELASTIARGQSAELIATMQPSRRRVTVTRTQEVEVEVDAYSDVEATWVAVHDARSYPDGQWTTTGLRSGFHQVTPNEEQAVEVDQG